MTLLAMALAQTKVSHLKRVAGRIRSKSRLLCGGLVTANERDSRVAVVHGCSSATGDSILSTFSWEPLVVRSRVSSVFVI